MERRKFPRKIIDIDAEIISDYGSFRGRIKNVSERGIGIESEANDLLSESTGFLPGSKYQIKFITPAGEHFTLNCKVMWSFKTGPDGMTNMAGLEVIFPPPDYIKFCRTS